MKQGIVIQESGKVEDAKKKLRELNEKLEILKKAEGQKGGSNESGKIQEKELGVVLEEKESELKQKRQMADQKYKEYQFALSTSHNANVDSSL